MSLFFHIKEAIKGLTKARLATILSITSIMLTIILLAIFIIFSLNLNTWINSFREKIEMEIFLQSTISDNQISEISDKLNRIPGIKSSQYVSKDDAANRFKEEFGQDIYEVLDFNPLPRSFVLTLDDTTRNLKSIERISTNIRSITQVEDIVYQKDILESVDKYITYIMFGAFFIGIIITLIAIALIYNTIRLTIYARKDAIYIMRLVGATQRFIRTPFVIEGMLQGLIASSLACIIIHYIVRIIVHLIYPFLIFDDQVYIYLIGFGLIIGIVSASLSVAKFLKIY